MPTTTKKDTAEQEVFKIGNIDLKIQKENSEYLPQENNIIGNTHELENIALGIRDNLPVLLIGDTGTGKTSFIRYLAFKTNNGFRRLNLNGSTTTDELIGHYVVDDKEVGMRWIDGVLVEAMKKGCWLLLDELNAGLPEVLFALQSLLDDDKFIVLSEHEGEIIRPHHNFRIFATMNPSLEYAGTRDLNKALLSRFPIVIQTQYPDAIHETEIIKAHVPEVEEADLSLMVRVAEDIRKGKDNQTISFICSTRELINWAKLTQRVGIKDAALLAVINKCEIDTDRKTIEDIFKMQFGRWDKKEIITLSQIESQIETMKKGVQDLEKSVKEKDALLASKEEELQSYRKVIGMAKEDLKELKS